MVKLRRKVSSLFKTKPALRPILKKPKSWPSSNQQPNKPNDQSINFEESEKLKLVEESEKLKLARHQSAPQQQQDTKPASKYLHHLKGTLFSREKLF